MIVTALRGELNGVLSKVVVFFKTHPKHKRLFKSFREDIDEDHIKLLLHTEIRWLSQDNCLKRFVSLYGSVTQFLG